MQQRPIISKKFETLNAMASTNVKKLLFFISLFIWFFSFIFISMMQSYISTTQDNVVNKRNIENLSIT